ncbi:peptidylprolyl isomerase [Mesorhizobium sp. BAC0120]|uniref:peptidylprolyl isomerase n=1 Tax=Mesorhizobium sp. BAC0120 TaxID=3090670 RepID=UPI00298CF69A|nr:peptidylprolyl isomerase [Mesorhizobium sp. BAC0120]MDW6026371.1 peptidylprolyl isomerase [Mesorhizobium sp. BAC0120]
MNTSPLRGLLVRLTAVAALLIIGTAAGFAEDKPQPTPAAPPAPNTVLGTVNGQPITEADLELALADLDQQFSRLPEEQRRAAAMSAIIEIRVLAAKGVEEGLDKTDEFQRRIAFLRDRSLHSAVVEKDVAGKITDQDIRARYDQEVANQPPVNEVKARHILVKTKEEAQDIIKQLDAGGDFEKLANEKTNDPSGKTSGGDLGWFGPGQMVPEFEKAAFALNAGQYTKEPVQTQFGWHVIKVEDKRAKQPPAFEQVKDQVRSMLLRDEYFAFVKQVRDAAKIEIADPDLKNSVGQLEKSQQ